jgi:hypothetical protein
MVLVGVLIWFGVNAGGSWCAGAGSAGGLLTILPAGPLTAGMYVIAQRVSEGRATKPADVWSGIRTYTRSFWVVLGIWITGFMLFSFNIGYYGRDAEYLRLGHAWSVALLPDPLVRPVDLCTSAGDPSGATRSASDCPYLRSYGMLGIRFSRWRHSYAWGCVLGLSIFLVAPIVLFGAAWLILWSFRATHAVLAHMPNVSVMMLRVKAARRRSASLSVDAKGQVRPIVGRWEDWERDLC